MPYINDSTVSCGVLEFSEFYSYRYPNEAKLPPEEIFTSLCSELKEYAGNEGGLPCRFLVFSDVVKGPGDVFGKYLKKRFPKNKITRVTGTNPNSDNNIALYTWRINGRDLFATPEWKAATRSYRMGEETFW